MYISLLLTSCIDPGFVHSVARRDISTRLNDYIISLKFWLHLPSIMNIVFCDNSGFDLTCIRELVRTENKYNKKIEILSFYGQPELPEYGKGYGEMSIIHYALEHSDILSKTNMIMKVTGRFIVSNATSLVQAVSGMNGIDVFCDLRRNLSTSDSRGFLRIAAFSQTIFSASSIFNERIKWYYFRGPFGSCCSSRDVRWFVLVNVTICS